MHLSKSSTINDANTHRFPKSGSAFAVSLFELIKAACITVRVGVLSSIVVNGQSSDVVIDSSVELLSIPLLQKHLAIDGPPFINVRGSVPGSFVILRA